MAHQAHAPLTIVDLPDVLLQQILKAFVTWPRSVYMIPSSQQDARTLIRAACAHSALRAAARQVIPQGLEEFEEARSAFGFCKIGLRSLPPFLSCIVSNLVVGSPSYTFADEPPPVFDSHVDGFCLAPILFALLQRPGQWRSFCIHTKALESELYALEGEEATYTYHPHDDLYLNLTGDASKPKLTGTLSFRVTAPTIDGPDGDVYFAPDPEAPEFIDVELAALDAPALTVTPRGAGPIWSCTTLRLLKPHHIIEFGTHDDIDPEDSEIETGWGSMLISREATPADSPDTGKIGLLLRFIPEGMIESDEESLTGGEEEDREEDSEEDSEEEGEEESDEEEAEEEDGDEEGEEEDEEEDEPDADV